MATKPDSLSITSTALGVPSAWLARLINFESSGNPQARNKFTGARGLIQFLHSTAKSLGFADADDLVAKHPDRESQILGPVYKYLKQFAPFPTEQSLYMAVFYPKARKWALNQPFPQEVQRVNPGIITVNDYVSRVQKGNSTLSAGAVGKKLFIIAIIGVSVYLIYNHFQKKGLPLWRPTSEQLQKI
jgi:hypothetical protein